MRNGVLGQSNPMEMDSAGSEAARQLLDGFVSRAAISSRTASTVLRTRMLLQLPPGISPRFSHRAILLLLVCQFNQQCARDHDALRTANAPDLSNAPITSVD